jgi:hypothetical protein
VEIDEAIRRFDSKFQETIAPLMSGGTMKYHRFVHLTDIMRRLGRLSEYSSQFYEASNKIQKLRYDATSKRLTGDQFLYGMVAAEQLRAALSEVSTYDHDGDVVNMDSAYLRASRTGEHCIAKKALCTIVTNGLGQPSAKASEFVSLLDDYADIREAIRRYYGLDSVDNPNMPKIKPRSTAVLSAEVEWNDSESELQTIRASADFHSRPYYDNVLVRYTVGGRVVQRYGELRLLFTAVDPDSFENDTLICVKWYKHEKRCDDVLVRNGCTHLTWDSRGYGVVSLNNVVRRVYVVSDFTREDTECFHICPFKWNRSPIQD